MRTWSAIRRAQKDERPWSPFHLRRNQPIRLGVFTTPRDRRIVKGYGVAKFQATMKRYAQLSYDEALAEIDCQPCADVRSLMSDLFVAKL